MLEIKSLVLRGVILGLLSACKPTLSPDDARVQQYEEQLTRCAAKLAESPVVPIVGGGQFDTSLFAAQLYTVRYDGGQCGTDGFEADFYWTGQGIVPASPRFTGVPAGKEPPADWTLFRVAAKFGNLTMARYCKDKGGAVPECPRYESVAAPKAWPSHLKVRPRSYPDLEIWLS